MIRACRSRSASAWRDMERFIESGSDDVLATVLRRGEAAADHQPLNLVGALEDLRDLGFAHVALDAVVAGVTRAAETCTASVVTFMAASVHTILATWLGASRACRVAPTRGVEVGGACKPTAAAMSASRKPSP